MKKRRISIQKIFNIVSLVFLLTCCIFYGGRFIKLYLENKEKVVVEANTLGKDMKEKNVETLKNINGEYYFNGKVDNNYVSYSGILWRVIKISDNNIITMVSDNSLTSLAFGKDKTYEESYVNNWLNENDSEYSGILESNLNSVVTYLKNADLCTNKIDDVSNSNCTSINNDYYLSTLSINDYINTGAANGFINTSEDFYLSNITSDNQVWYVNTEGKMDKSDGTDIYGIKAVIKTKENLNLVSGDGTKENPYVFESNFGLFGSYIKLDEDIWRVIDVNDDKLKLVYDDYVKNGDDYVSYKYSNYNAKYDSNKYGTLAYYMNKTFLNNLSYKDLIVEGSYSNGYYGVENGYDYTDTLSNTINTKVALVSIGDINLNHDLYNYFTITSSAKNNNFVYTIQRDSNPYSKIISSTSHIVPVITINNSEFEGNGTKNDPLRLVNDNA